MAVVGVAALGVPTAAEAIPDVSIWDEAIPDSVLDLPVSPDNPLCWVELDGVRYGLADARLEVYTNHVKITDVFMDQYAQLAWARSWKIDCWSYGYEPQLIKQLRSGNKMACVLSIGSHQCFACDVLLTSYFTSVRQEGKIACDFVLHSAGELRML